MKKFPTGSWRVQYAKVIGRLRYNAERNIGWITSIQKPSGWFTCGEYGDETRLVNVVIQGYELTAVYDAQKKGGGAIHSGDLRARLQKDGGLRLELNRLNAGSRTMETFWATPESGSLHPNLADAGYHHTVRFSGGGLSVKTFGAAAMGNVEVRDLGAGWERHYALVAGGAGASLGISFPSSTNWVPCYLTPRCHDWTNATVTMHTAGAAVIVGYNSCHARFNLPNGASWTADWSGWGASLQAQIDLSTVVAGKLMGVVYDKPYFADAG